MSPCRGEAPPKKTLKAIENASKGKDNSKEEDKFHRGKQTFIESLSGG